MPTGDSGGKPCRACSASGQALRDWNHAAQAAQRLAERTEQQRRAADSSMAIVDCQLCDDDGYRNGVVCDHVDRIGVAEAGMAKVRAALAKGTES
jgi:hypothetical protein